MDPSKIVFAVIILCGVALFISAAVRDYLAARPSQPIHRDEPSQEQHFHFDGCFWLRKNSSGMIFLCTVSSSGHLEQMASRPAVNSFLRTRKCCQGEELLSEVRC
jgi:hypothetical protein